MKTSSGHQVRKPGIIARDPGGSGSTSWVSGMHRHYTSSKTFTSQAAARKICRPSSTTSPVGNLLGRR